MGTMHWKPTWWTEDKHGSTWERVKEAMHRDWEQTKKDFKVGGHEMNQSAKDTVKQAVGKEAIPPADKPNPPKVIGNWDDVEMPMGYGYSAREHYGAAHKAWNDDLESKLKSEWETGKAKTLLGWDDVKAHVRRGFEWKGDRDSRS